jgi:hypothetical protein
VDGLPVLGPDVERGVDHVDARVVDQQVDAADGLLQPGDGLGGLLDVGDVEHHRLRSVAPGDLLRARAVARGSVDGGAELLEALGDGRTQPPAGPGDQGAAPVEPEVEGHDGVPSRGCWRRCGTVYVSIRR